MMDKTNLKCSVLNLRDSANGFATSLVLLQTESLKLSRIQLDARETTEKCWPAGEVIVECQIGQVRLQTQDEDSLLQPGHAKHLEPGVAWSLYAVTRSVVTVLESIRSAVISTASKRDVVAEASEDSFPASDPPSWSPVISS